MRKCSAILCATSMPGIGGPAACIDEYIEAAEIAGGPTVPRRNRQDQKAKLAAKPMSRTDIWYMVLFHLVVAGHLVNLL